jgi:hypothetical protein
VIILLVANKSVIGLFITASQPIVTLGWLATIAMGAVAVRM